MSSTAPSRRCRVLPSRAAAALMAFALISGASGCSGSSTPADAAPRSEPSSSTTATTLWDEFRETVDRPAAPLSVDLGLTPPPEFTQADVDVLAARAISVLERSTAPRLSSMDPDEAVDYVYADQPTQTRLDFERDAIKTNLGRPWQWMAASRFETKPSRAKLIRVAANVKRYDGTYDDGTPAPYLAVTVEAHAVQEVPVTGPGFEGEETVPIVTYRAVNASSFRPRGGPDWWPAVRARMSPFGNDGCALGEEDALLVPLTDPDRLREDLANLRSTLRNPEVADTEFTAPNPTAQERELTEKEYEDYRAECDD